MSNKKYELKEYKFIAKEQKINEPFVTIESMRGEISEFENSIIYFWVDDGGIEKAQEIAKILNNHIAKIGFERLE